MRSHAVLASLFSLALGCAPGGGDESTVIPDYGDKADGWSNVVVQAGDLEVTLAPELARDGDRFVLSGRTDIASDGGAAFVRSRANATAAPVGEWTQVDDESFELSLSEAEIVQVTAGAGLYIDLELQGVTEHYVLEVHARPLVTSYTGGVNPLMALEPYYVDGRVSYRLEGHRSSKWYGPQVALGEDVLGGVQPDERRAYFDVPEELFVQYLGNDKRFQFISASGSGGFSAVISEARLQRGQKTASQVYVSEFCWNGNKTCLKALAEGSRDTSSCGTAIEVLACQAEVGMRVDEALAESALAENPVDDSEIEGLIGAARAPTLKAGLESARESLVAARVGAWYLDEASARASIADQLARLRGKAYAFPFQWVEALPLRADNPADAAQVAADALLLYLPSEDLVNSEFDSTLTRIATDSPADHVAVFRQLRSGEPNEDEPYTEVEVNGDRYSVSTSWLGAYIEITVRPDADASVYFEID